MIEWDIQKADSRLISRQQVHLEDSPEDYKLQPKKVDNCCRIPPINSRACQIANCGTDAVTNDCMHIARMVVCVGALTLQDHPAHDEVSMAV